MKITVEQHHIAAVMRRVIGVVEKRSTLTIVQNVLIEARDDRLTVRVTDLDMEAVDVCPCAVETAGVVTVEASKLNDIVRNFTAGSVVKMELGESDDPRLVVAAGRSRFRLPTLPPEDFPSLYGADWDTKLPLSTADLLGILTRSSYAAAVNETRAILNGTHIHTIGGRLRSTAMNGPRIGYSEMDMPSSDELAATLPPKMVTEMKSRLAETKDLVCELLVNQSRASLVIGDSVVSSKLIDGAYIEYDRAIPRGDATRVQIDADALMAAVRSVLIVATMDKGARSIRFGLSKDLLTVSGKDTHADARSEVAIDYEGEPMEIGLNGANILDALAAFACDVVEVEIHGAVKPTIWRKAGDPSTLAAFAPMRV